MHRMNMSLNLNESLEPGDNVTYLVHAMWTLRKTFRGVESQKTSQNFLHFIDFSIILHFTDSVDWQYEIYKITMSLRLDS